MGIDRPMQLMCKIAREIAKASNRVNVQGYGAEIKEHITECTKRGLTFSSNHWGVTQNDGCI